jgi:hypothetical protein
MGTNINTNTDYDTNSNVLGNSLNGLLSNIGTDYKFLYFKPDSNGYPTGYGACYASKENSGTPSINMVPINTVLNTKQMLHTNESCKLNASLLQSANKWSEQKNINKWPSSQKSKGLSYNTVSGYFGTNVKYFLGQKPDAKGMATDFSAAANTNNTTNPYSIEWYGFFKPTITGNWTYTINSTKNNFLWLGDVAVNDFTYSTAQLTTGKTQTFTFNCNKGRLYPIRIQCGFVNQGDVFSLTITDPNGSTPAFNDVFVTYFNGDGTVFEKSMMYYSLSDSGTPGLYNCFVSSQAIGDVPKFKTQPSSYTFKTVWQLLKDGDPGLSEYNTFQFVAKKNQGDDDESKTGTLSVSTNGGSVISSISDPNTLTPILFNEPVNLSLDDNGQLSSDSLNINYAPNIVASSNADWIAFASANNIPSSISDVSQLDTNIYPNNRIVAGTVILISPSGKYKLELSANGNLVLKTSNSACPTVSDDSIYYSGTNDNSHYIYRVDADEKLDKMFIASNKSSTLIPISYDNPAFKPSSLTADDYNKYDNYYPDDITGAVAQSEIQCKTACKSDPDCKYIYSYNSAGTNYCLKKSDGHLPKQLIPKQPTSNIQSSTLYVRGYNSDFPKADPRTNIPTTVTNNYASYADYELLIDKPFIVSDLHNIGYNGLDADLKNRLIINYNYLKGNGQPVGQKPIVETFDTHGFQDGNVVRQTSGNPGDTDNLPNRIMQNQITPLTGIATDYSNLLGAVDGKYRDIRTNIAGYNSARQAVSYDSTIKGDVVNDSKKVYDFETQGRTLLYNERKPTMADAINEDLNMLILEENQLYMLGTITIATLLVGAIYFGKE